MKRALTYLLLIALGVSCRTNQPATTSSNPTDDGKIEIVFLQMNDVYEIAPLEGGKTGGLARVAALRDQLREKNFNTYTVLAGDFLNPSVIGTLKYEGERIAGKQMVEVLNALNLDLATFGNHEFDLSEADLLKRLRESDFGWVSSNVAHATGSSVRPFTSGPDNAPIAPTWIFNCTDEDGTQLRVGVIGLTLPANKKEYLRYEDFYSAAANTYASLANNTDYVIGLTHLSIAEDKELSRRVPGLRLIMGGHDHDHMYHQVGASYIAKADANAKTVYVHRLTFDKGARQLQINSQLVPITDSLTPEPKTAATVKKWTDIAAKSFQELGFNPDEVLMTAAEPLDGRESSVRHHPTNLTELIVRAVSAAAPQAALTVLNSGSIRVDDQLAGNITQYDVIRALPFGGKIQEVDMRGELLEKVLTVGRSNAGEGGYLQLDRATFDEKQNRWLINNKALAATQTYRVALPAFLLTGGEKNLDFLKPDNPGVVKVYEPDPQDKNDLRNDIRSAVIAYMRRVKN